MADAAIPDLPDVMDACGREIVPVPDAGNPIIDVEGGIGTVTYRYTYTDCAGHDSVWTFIYTITPDQFIPPADYEENIHCESEALNDTVPAIPNCGEYVDVVTGTHTNNLENGCGDIAYVYNYTVNGTDYTWTHYYHVQRVQNRGGHGQRGGCSGRTW